MRWLQSAAGAGVTLQIGTHLWMTFKTPAHIAVDVYMHDETNSITIREFCTIMHIRAFTPYSREPIYWRTWKSSTKKRSNRMSIVHHTNNSYSSNSTAVTVSPPYTDALENPRSSVWSDPPSFINEPVQSGQTGHWTDTYVQTRPDTSTGQIRLLTTIHKMDTGQTH